MAFLSTPGIERLYSGVTNSRPWALLRSLVSRLTEVERHAVAPLAVWGLDDVEIIEGLGAGGFDLRGTPRGPLKVLRKWDLAGGRFPSWRQFIEDQFSSAPEPKRLRVPTLKSDSCVCRACIVSREGTGSTAEHIQRKVVQELTVDRVLIPDV